MPSNSTSKTSELYGQIAEVHFTINRNKSGWYITEYFGGASLKTYGPLEGPINKLDALSYLIANSRFNH